ncbi:MAG: hypothetical protein IT431_03450 [Phycisphaerales bacterium]|nr:hypothetical protein [Phycisphaerales bacterium]
MVFGLVVLVLGLVGLVCVLGGNEVVQAIGTSLVASAVVGALELYYRAIVAEHDTLAAAVRDAGVAELYSHRDIDKYHTLMTSLSCHLDICGYSLRAFYESFGDLLLELSTQKPALQVRMLFVDPRSDISVQRERIERHAPGTFQASIAKILGETGAVANVQIRLLDRPISTMFYRIDQTMFVGPQFFAVPSKSAPTLELRAGSHAWLFEAFQDEFECMWSAAKTVTQTEVST